MDAHGQGYALQTARPFGAFPMWQACERGDHAAVASLLRSGHSITECKDVHGTTAVHVAW